MTEIPPASEVVADALRALYDDVNNVHYMGSGRTAHVFMVSMCGGRYLSARLFRASLSMTISQLQPAIDGGVLPIRVFHENVSVGRWLLYNVEIAPMVEGVTISGALARNEVKSQAWLYSLARTLHRLHTTPLAAASRGLGVVKPHLFLGKYEGCVRDLEGILDSDQLKKVDKTVTTWSKHLRNEIVKQPLCPIHGDLSFSNIVLRMEDSTQVSGLIDWDTLRMGDYLWDLANYCTFAHDSLVPEHLLEVYHLRPWATDEVSYLWSREDVSRSLVYLRFWYYYVLISAEKLVDLHKMGYQDLTKGINRLMHGVNQLRD